MFELYVIGGWPGERRGIVSMAPGRRAAHGVWYIARRARIAGEGGQVDTGTTQPNDGTEGAAGPSFLRAFMDGSLTSGYAFGTMVAWCFLSTASMSPVSSNLAFSPLALSSVAGMVAMVVLLRMLVKGHASASTRGARDVGVACVVIGSTLCLLLGSLGMPLALRYAVCAALGACMALALGSCVYLISTQAGADRVAAIVVGLLMAGVLEALAALLLMRLPDAHVVSPLMLGILAAVGVAVCAVGENRVDPVAYRPSASQHYHLLAVAFAMYVFVFGMVNGTSSNGRGMDGAQVEAESELITGIALFVTALLPVVWSMFTRRTPDLRVVGRILTPVLAILFLGFIVTPDQVRHYLPALTMAFWQVVEAYVILLIIDISRSGVASVSLVFCAGWAVVCGGHALGVIVGQSADLLLGAGEDVVQSITAFQTIIAVIASSLAMGARFPVPTDDTVVLPMVTSFSDASADAGAAGRGDAGRPEAGEEAPAQPARDEVGAACDRIVTYFGLSEREAEVCELLTRGNTRAGIASRLFVSENTVRTHVKNIYAKLHIHSKQQLIDLVDSERREPGSARAVVEGQAGDQVSPND